MILFLLGVAFSSLHDPLTPGSKHSDTSITPTWKILTAANECWPTIRISYPRPVAKKVAMCQWGVIIALYLSANRALKENVIWVVFIEIVFRCWREECIYLYAFGCKWENQTKPKQGLPATAPNSLHCRVSTVRDKQTWFSQVSGMSLTELTWLRSTPLASGLWLRGRSRKWNHL